MIDKNDWRLLNDVDHLRGAYINPTDGEEILQNAKHLDHCVFCYDTVNNDRHQFWYVPESISCCICERCFKDFNEMFKWKLLDGYDIEWTLKDTIDTYIKKIKLHDIKYTGMIPYSKLSADLKEESLQGNYFLKKTEDTDVSLFKKEFGYDLPQDLQEYLNLYWHPGIFGWDKFYECIVLDAVLKYENESADDVLTGTHGLIYHAKKWRDLFGGNINEYLPIGTLVSSESYVLYEIKNGRIFMEDADFEGEPEKEPFENSLKELIQHLQPVKPAYMDLKFTLEDVENPMYKKGDFQYEAHVGKGMFYNVLADGRPYFQVEAYPKKLFETAEIYLHYLLIGTDCDMMYIFDLWDLKANILPKVIKVNGYFESFYYNTDPQCAFPENIFITDSFGIIALDHHLAELWRNHGIEDDGVRIHEIVDFNTMRVSCGMDPPDGDWVEKLIDVRTGEVVGKFLETLLLLLNQNQEGKMPKKNKAIMAVSVILSSIILIIAVFSVREKILRRAEWTQGTFEFDGKTYEEIDYREIGSYEETWKVVSKITDGVWTIYEIAEFPDHEYVVARTGWEAGVLKHKD